MENGIPLLVLDKVKIVYLIFIFCLLPESLSMANLLVRMLSQQSASLKQVARMYFSYKTNIFIHSYVLKLEKADVYRLPYLSSSGPGFALLEATRKINFTDTLSQIASGFASGSWDKPVLVAWGISDKYLPQSVAEEFQKGNPGVVKLKLIEGAGHMPQEDWPEKVVDALRLFF
ncbi:hypothetical protein Patl1_34598 [Pistacia atlantica]|uniref:Uncharacterized protein n=1 Tax=Pistacia atlantica TaxID=434234 RepID=A0ACC0ZTA5_9ROSI|nr:hypothetical protein Patl1_34598 [Pistacia atlantica]